MRKCITMLVMLLFTAAFSYAAPDMTILDHITIDCSTTAQEVVLSFQETTSWSVPVASGGSGWALLHEFESSASGTVEIKYTEQYPDLNENDTTDEYDDNDWKTLETARTYDTSTNIWFHHPLKLDACFYVRVYLDHSDATGTHTIYLVGIERD